VNIAVSSEAEKVEEKVEVEKKLAAQPVKAGWGVKTTEIAVEVATEEIKETVEDKPKPFLARRFDHLLLLLSPSFFLMMSFNLLKCL
jgi:hypothetical protein